MKLKVSIILLFLGAIKLLSQDYFNSIIPFELGNPNPNNILINNDVFIVSAIHLTEGSDATSFILFDNTLSSFDYITTKRYFITHNDPFYSDGFFYALGNRDINPEMISFMRFDENFNLLDTLDYNTPSGDNFATSSTFFNGHLYGASVDDYNSGTSDYQRQSTLFKFDILGQEIWSVNMGQSDRNTYVWDLDHSLDDHLLISSMVYSEQRKPLVQLTKMDIDHQVVWNSRIEDEINCCAVPAWVTTLSDSSIVQAYALDKRQNLEWQTAREHYPFPPKLLWYDKDGSSYQDTLIRSPYFDQTRINQIESGHGDYFFGYGDYNKDSDIDEETFWGWLFKMSNSGEMLWSKRYRHPDYLTSEGQHTINDIVELDNGDIVMLGRLNNIGGASEIWLLKVNEHGCFGEEVCEEDLVTSSREINNDIYGIKIYPNPSDGIFNISIPDDLSIVQVRVLDMTGQLVSSLNHRDVELLDLSNQPSGVYVVEMRFDNGVIINKKIIIY